MIDKGKCDDVFIWNPSVWECDCFKSYDVEEYLNYANCKCSKRWIDQPVEECSKDINGNEMIFNVTLNDHRKAWNKSYYVINHLI